tara:strand:- start:308 stop:454 length:147 start_codon:yes stop_codon:yes gene_type:complete
MIKSIYKTELICLKDYLEKTKKRDYLKEKNIQLRKLTLLEKSIQDLTG